MRYFQDFFEAAREIERDLFEMGITSKSITHQNKVREGDDYESKELIGYSICIDMNADLNFNKVKEAMEYLDKDFMRSIDYCITEHVGRVINDPNPGRSWLIYKELWEEFLNSEGKFDYTYYERFHRDDQLSKVIEELVNNPETRRAILAVYHADLDTQLRCERLRIPCSMYYQFLYRIINNEPQIDVIYVMRSCDFYTHWIHDVFMAMLLADHIRLILGRRLGTKIKLGKLIQQFGSLHMFKKDYKNRDIF